MSFKSCAFAVKQTGRGSAGRAIYGKHIWLQLHNLTALCAYVFKPFKLQASAYNPCRSKTRIKVSVAVRVGINGGVKAHKVAFFRSVSFSVGVFYGYLIAIITDGYSIRFTAVRTCLPRIYPDCSKRKPCRRIRAARRRGSIFPRADTG